MSKQVLIVENDSNLSHAMRDKLVAKGFSVEETQDGKGSAELIRRTKPELVVLAVDLAAGQNGYIICKKLKSDDELKGIPVIIIGNPDGFAAHRKLKTHADDYLGKPFDPQAVVDRAGALVGFPEPPVQEVVEDDGLNLNELLSEDGAGAEAPGDTSEETVGAVGPRLRDGRRHVRRREDRRRRGPAPALRRRAEERGAAGGGAHRDR